MKTLWTHGKFYLEKGKFAQAILTEDGRIKKLGKLEDFDPKEADQVVDLGGKTVLPGLNDSHCHMSAVGKAMMEVDLNTCQSVEECIEKTKAFIEDHPQWTQDFVHTMSWNEDHFTEGEKRSLNRWDLDRMATDRPIILERICGHIGAVNSYVIEKMGITKDTPDPKGGKIDRDQEGNPTGIFRERALEWVKSLLGRPSKDYVKTCMKLSLDYALSVGITSVQSNDMSPSNIKGHYESLRDLYEKGEVQPRYRHQFCVESKEELEDLVAGEFQNPIYQGKTLTIGPVKMFKDGSLGARTALMKEAYAHDPGNHGVRVLSLEDQKKMVAMADQRGFQVVTHVIGDLAAQETIDVYKEFIKEGKNPLGHGLIHLQITDQEVLDDVVKLDLPVYFQPIFLDYDVHIAEDRVGKDLMKTSYAFKTLAERGVKIGYGTDAPVEDLNPFPCIYAAVTRQDKNGYPEGGFFPEERVDLETAIDAYSLGSAQMEFMEEEKGRIREGYLADFIVLDRDIFSIPDEEIKDVQVLKTIVGGQVVYEK